MFKNPQTKYYYTELSLPGYGKVRRRSLGTKRKSDAKALENAIREVHRRGLLDPRLFQLLDAIQGRGHGASGALTPEDLLVAVRDTEGADAGLGRLLRRLDDPELAKVIAAYLGAIEGEPGSDEATREDNIALPVVLRYADHLSDERPSRLSFPSSPRMSGASSRPSSAARSKATTRSSPPPSSATRSGRSRSS